MCRRFIAVATAVALCVVASTAFAQCGCAPATTYAPITASYTSYYAPTVTYYEPAPYVSYYAPATSYVTYYSAPVAPTVTYYAPAVRPYVAYYGVWGATVYGTPKIFVPGQPVRNALRAVTP